MRNYPLQFVKYRFYSAITPDFFKMKRLKQIETEAEKIAAKKHIPLLVRCKVKDGSETYYSIGFHYKFQQQENGKYDIYIYRPYLMAPKLELLKTIFHEYGHFIDYCTSENTIVPLKLLYSTNKFPKSRSNFTEDFAELFAEYMLDLIELDNEYSKTIDAVINDGIVNLQNKNTKKHLDCINFNSNKDFRIGQF